MTPSTPNTADLVAEGNRWHGEEWIEDANPALTAWIALAADLITAQQREIEGLKLKIDGADFFCDGRVEAYKQEAAAAKAKAEALEKERDELARDKAELSDAASVLMAERDKAEAEVAELRAKLREKGHD